MTHKILIVEDEEDLRNHYKMHLEKAGYNVVATGNVQDAKHKLSNEKFNLVILDLRLGGGSGIEVIDQMKKDTASNLNLESHILAISGHMDNDTLNQIGRRVQGALVKPFKLKDLMTKVKELCAPPS
jgi:two-component system phosphate regulon response regulator PhoB